MSIFVESVESMLLYLVWYAPGGWDDCKELLCILTNKEKAIEKVHKLRPRNTANWPIDIEVQIWEADNDDQDFKIIVNWDGLERFWTE